MTLEERARYDKMNEKIFPIEKPNTVVILIKVVAVLLILYSSVMIPILYSDQMYHVQSTLYPNISFSLFVYSKYDPDVKGEFESTAAYEERKNDIEKQHEYMKTVLAVAEKEFIKMNTASSEHNPRFFYLGKYDADNGLFLFGYNNIPGYAYSVRISPSEAPAFKAAFDSIRTEAVKNAVFFIQDDFLSLAKVTFTMPDGKKYTYENSKYENYKGATIKKIKLYEY